MMQQLNDVTITIIEARNLKAADLNGKSDPYVKIKDVKGLKGDGAKTRVIKKTLNPQWNETFRFRFSYKLYKFAFKVYDWDMVGENDAIGKASIPVEKCYSGPFDGWVPLKPKGELHVRIEVQWKIPLALPGTTFAIPTNPFYIGLGWDMRKKGPNVDLDASIAGLDGGFGVIDTVNFQKLKGFNGAVTHSGDNRTGHGDGDDEVVTFYPSMLPPHLARFVIVLNSFTCIPLSKVKSAYVRLFGPNDHTIAFFRINNLTNEIGLLLSQITRDLGTGQLIFSATTQSGPGKTLHESLKWIVPALSGGRVQAPVGATKQGQVPPPQQYGQYPGGQQYPGQAAGAYPPQMGAYQPPAGAQYGAGYPGATTMAPPAGSVPNYGYAPPTGYPQGAPPQQGYGAPPAGYPGPGGYAAPPAGAFPPQQQQYGYGAPPQQQQQYGYGAPPPQGQYGYGCVPGQAATVGAPPPYAGPQNGNGNGAPMTTQGGVPSNYGWGQGTAPPPAAH
ncbi:hypothetical protein HK102_002275 [Quaeritorhiza haematococci]|nr:hypothetical protein HK102_002275 [Quaeritorhiza haematococci]